MGVDLFQRIVLKGVAPGEDLSGGYRANSEADALIQLLEQQNLQGQQTRTVAAETVPQASTSDILNDGAFWALSTMEDLPLLREMVSDVTTVSGFEWSSQGAALGSWGGQISAL